MPPQRRYQECPLSQSYLAVRVHIIEILDPPYAGKMRAYNPHLPYPREK